MQKYKTQVRISVKLVCAYEFIWLYDNEDTNIKSTGASAGHGYIE